MTPSRSPLLFLAALTLLRYAYIAVVPPMPHDAFMWLCAGHLDQAFFDAPAGLPLLTHGLLSLFGDTSLALRIASPLFALLASLAIGALARELVSESAGGLAALLLNLLPSFNVAAVSSDATCATLFLAAVGSRLLWRSFHVSGGRLHSIGAGVIAAIGLTMSYAFVAVLAAWGVAALCHSRKARRRNLSNFGWISLIALIAVLSPLLWNIAHNWPILGDWTLKRVFVIDWAALPDGITAWTIAASPLLLVAFAALVPGLIDEARAHPRYRFLACLGLLPLAITLVSVLIGTRFPSTLWTLSAAFLLLPLVARIARTSPGWWPVVAGVAAATSALVLLATRTEAVRWEGLASLVTRIHSDQQVKRDESLFLIAWDPDAVSIFSYPTPHAPFGRAPEVHPLERQAIVDQFGLWPSYDDFIETEKPPDEFFTEQRAVNPYVGKSAIYIGPEPPDALPQAITAGFAEVVPLCSIPDSPAKHGKQLLNVYLCRSYQTLPL